MWMAMVSFLGFSKKMCRPAHRDTLAWAGSFLDNWLPPFYNELVAVRRSGGIGRRTGLKIPGRQRRAGSSPAFGTSKELHE